MRGFDGWLERLIRRLPFGNRIAPMQQRLASFAEQGLQGVANLFVNIVLARSLTHEGFATIGLMLGIHYFVLGLHRTAIVLPYILDASEQEEEAQQRWWWLNLASLFVIAAAIAIIAGIVYLCVAGNPRDYWFADAIALTALVTPALLFFEFGRRTLYQRLLPATAALSSACYLVVNLGAAIALTRIEATPLVGALAWVAAGLVGGAINTFAAPPGRPRLRSGFEIWWRNRSFAFWQAMTNFPYAIYNSSVVVLVGLINGPIAAAAFSAARSLTNPAISIVTAVDSLDKPRAARGLATGGLDGLRQSVGRTRRLLFLITGTYLGLMIIFAEPILHLAFANDYAQEVDEMRVLGLTFFAMCMNQPSETFLIVLRESRLLLALRIVTATIAVTALIASKPYGVLGCCVALLATNLINLVNLHLAEKLAARRWIAAHPAAADSAIPAASQ